MKKYDSACKGCTGVGCGSKKIEPQKWRERKNCYIDITLRTFWYLNGFLLRSSLAMYLWGAIAAFVEIWPKCDCGSRHRSKGIGYVPWHFRKKCSMYWVDSFNITLLAATDHSVNPNRIAGITIRRSNIAKYTCSTICSIHQFCLPKVTH